MATKIEWAAARAGECRLGHGFCHVTVAVTGSVPPVAPGPPVMLNVIRKVSRPGRHLMRSRSARTCDTAASVACDGRRELTASMNASMNNAAMNGGSGEKPRSNDRY